MTVTLPLGDLASAQLRIVADPEALAREDARPADFVDLGDEAELRVETMEGECSACLSGVHRPRGPRARGRT